MSTIKVNTLTTLNGSGNITVSRPFTGLSGSGASLTALNATELTSGTIPIARIADDAVTLAKMADDAIGVAQLSATGTASNSVFLRGDNSWATAGSTSASDLTSGTLPMARLSGTLPALNGSALTALNATNLGSGTVAAARLPDLGAWKLLSLQTASTSASLTQTGLSSTYENYAIVLCDLVPTTSGANCWIRLGDSSGIDSGGSDYGYHQQQIADATASYNGYPSTAASHMLVATAVSHYGGGAMSGLFYMQRPADTTTTAQIYPCIHGNHVNVNHPHLAFVGGSVYGVRKSVNMAVDRVQVLFSSGNISSGTFAVYGISKT